ncbi:MAG: hypothetical protein KGQ37_00780 [Hyphomicrobiales bacterium]|nr:hypothetical protein [Hyphomicrobiales bacterium]
MASLVLLMAGLGGCAEGKLGTVTQNPAPAAPAVAANAHGAGLELASFQTGSSPEGSAFPALFAKAASAHGIALTDATSGVTPAADVIPAPLLAKAYVSVGAGATMTSVVDIYNARHQMIIHIEDDQDDKATTGTAALAALADKTANDVAAFLAEHQSAQPQEGAAPATPAPLPALTTASAANPASTAELALAQTE